MFSFRCSQPRPALKIGVTGLGVYGCKETAVPTNHHFPREPVAVFSGDCCGHGQTHRKKSTHFQYPKRNCTTPLLLLDSNLARLNPKPQTPLNLYTLNPKPLSNRSGSRAKPASDSRLSAATSSKRQAALATMHFRIYYNILYYIREYIIIGYSIL